MTTPPPATTPWVPMWNLQGGVNFQYRGAWVAGTYTDGDIVVQNGIAYLCVRPTTLPPAVWPMAPGISQYATTLPASPYDGQEAVLVDNLTNPTYQWRFRYNKQSTSAYKWEFVGGSAARSEVAINNVTVEQITNTTWVNLTTIGPQVTVPRAGEYDINFGGEVQCTSGQYAQIAPKLGAVAVNDADPVNALGGTTSILASISRRFVRVCAANDVVLLQYRVTGGTGYYRYRWLSVQPVRVS